MKKTFKIIACVFCCLFSICLCACKEKTTLITNSAYFDNKVYYTTVSSSTNENDLFYELNNITTQNNELLNRYTKIKLTTLQDYSYKLTLHYFTFDVYSTEDVQIELVANITNLKNAKNNTLSQAVNFQLKKDAYTAVKIEVEDTFKDGISYITIENNSSPEIFSNNVDFKFQICNLKVYAEHII